MSNDIMHILVGMMTHDEVSATTPRAAREENDNHCVLRYLKSSYRRSYL